MQRRAAVGAKKSSSRSVIASSGLRGLKHRAIAQRAELRFFLGNDVATTLGENSGGGGSGKPTFLELLLGVGSFVLLLFLLFLFLLLLLLLLSGRLLLGLGSGFLLGGGSLGLGARFLLGGLDGGLLGL
jgi:hypothetical protein